MMSAGRCRAGRALALALMACAPAVARAESSLGAGVMLAGDDQGFRWDRYEVELRRDRPDSGQWLAVRFYTFELGQAIAGVLPFDGAEPAAELGGHVLHGAWWLLGSIGFQGSVDADGATGKLVVARALLAGSSTLTPRLEIAREPLSLTALPLSLGLSKFRFDALLAWRAPSWTAEGGARVELWESALLPGRTENPALDHVEPNRNTIAHAYALSDLRGWCDVGVAAKAAWSRENTMLLTGVASAPTYTWYPASAPPFLWETALVLRARGQLAEPVELSVQVQLPMLSQETREWDGLRRTYWGSAPFEGKLEARWRAFSATALKADAAIFAKPWERWDVFSDQAYRQGALHFSIEQRL